MILQEWTDSNWLGRLANFVRYLLNEWYTKDVASDPHDFSGQEEQFSRRPLEVAHYLAYTSCID